MNEEYPFSELETRWRKKWEVARIFESREDETGEKFYCLEMFPYPSGKLHMGHVRNYALGDALARFHMMNGKNVLHPMGWDGFGLPAENAAIERNVHPREWTYKNIGIMRNQLKRLGYSIDWSREIATCHPEYYRWCQWFFLKMLEKGLAYRKKSTVNWCESCRTVLANEQVEGGVCWRCHQPVISKELNGWFLKITAYAEELLKGLETLRGKWPERVLMMQRNWIGRSEGAWVDFKTQNGQRTIRVFTTRPDTLYGATFMVLAPENPLAFHLADSPRRRRELEAFAESVSRIDVIERTATGIPKRGIFTGSYAVNPLTNENIPIWVSDFVLMEYGTGAIMSVPAHDQRDFEFARKYGLPIRVVIAPPHTEIPDPNTMESAFDAEGVMVDSGPFTGLPSQEGIKKVIGYLEEKGLGEKAVTYRLRDWGISRQRYWGTPIPIVYCDRCGVVPVPETELPVRLPEDIHFDWSQGGNPLASVESFVNTTCPRCHRSARRETDTMDTFIDSAWYFARYTSPRDTSKAVNPQAARYWMPVDQYIGGIEHAVMHLMYARFFTMVMRDLGLVDRGEPFSRLLTQGMVCLEVMSCPQHGYLYPEEVLDMGNGVMVCARCRTPVIVGRAEKMSKSKRNTKDPEQYISRYGVDTIRMFTLFAAPPEKDLDWSDSGVEGVYRFLKKIWRLAYRYRAFLENSLREDLVYSDITDEAARALRTKTHNTIKRITMDFQGRYHFNTSVSACMELVNEMGALEMEQCEEAVRAQREKVMKEAFHALVPLINPFAPHLAEELWSFLGSETLLANGPWPVYDEKVAAITDVEIPIQVNGKVRARIHVEMGTEKNDLEERALRHETIQRWIEGKTIRKIVAIPNRLVNIVVTK